MARHGILSAVLASVAFAVVVASLRGVTMPAWLAAGGILAFAGALVWHYLAAYSPTPALAFTPACVAPSQEVQLAGSHAEIYPIGEPAPVYAIPMLTPVLELFAAPVKPARKPRVRKAAPVAQPVTKVAPKPVRKPSLPRAAAKAIKPRAVSPRKPRVSKAAE